MAKMTDFQAFINDFITIETKFDNADNSFETSEYTGVQDFFETHLSESITNEDDLKQYGISTYKLKTGNSIKLHPSEWVNDFSKVHNLNNDNKDYEFEYIIKDIEIKMHSVNPKSDGNIPKMRILITLSRK